MNRFEQLTVHKVESSSPRIVIGRDQSIHFVPQHSKIIDRSELHDLRRYLGVDLLPIHYDNRKGKNVRATAG
jgi:hypothetical protein